LEDKALKEKQAKADGYVSEPERFRVISLELEMRSKHGIRLISYEDGEWNCTCDFFRERGTCSHTMAAGRLLKDFPLPQPLGNT
jgi:hypothetical protein